MNCWKSRSGITLNKKDKIFLKSMEDLHYSKRILDILWREQDHPLHKHIVTVQNTLYSIKKLYLRPGRCWTKDIFKKELKRLKEIRKILIKVKGV